MRVQRGELVFAKSLKDHNDGISEEKLERARLAYRHSKYGHRNQWRDSGERYFEHPKRVARILGDELSIWDVEMHESALLHDVMEDTFLLTWKDLKRIFGPRVYRLVRLLTKDPKPNKRQKKTYLANIANATEDVKILKLADRLDNVRSLSACTPDKQARNLKETKEFFIPLARQTNAYLAQELEKACAAIEEQGLI
ncbi:MAG: hypothetical protein A3A80_04420 [Candidatus Terrybacteria bacterium RIFCSPLOWO2_01_FULL_44_24]|uniref:HD/PDEase domain-containing protein n=1 Tax=Candidatus Terrybacteria bacterium RIFCSPHIGHO2_01_FULL_43_35 TaxID=1802361 RepID=A0A1G2PDT2_9BACT|nr:MAG: hypothetical protein A2828_01295 [Candidatus Terrybacteria bacterium RIFCSPHIGHO2_01_FULL_43_35]OHA49665.1 MAG: hypothetical protein A3B75_01075 [Candidatus Terrybacteria bacterium RIFCSPHIGHO2_02_FULL_43_14]OHA51330.1 MAG: hypothetical protein A3A80_04420 [Candidatus Terrybacteria bacterium RIFCSPLOWO2_01_FULL_44_24]